MGLEVPTPGPSVGGPAEGRVATGPRAELMWLGQRIAHARQQRDLTQADLSEAAGVNRVTLSKIERGLTDVGFVRLNKIAHALGTTPGALLAEDADRSH